MAIQLRADDIMPWGTWEGCTLRQIYKKDRYYYRYLISKKKDYIINDETQITLEEEIDVYDKTPITASNPSYFNKVEYRFDDVIEWGKHKGKKLQDIFVENETYFRFIVENNNYYISPTTLSILRQYKERVK